MKMSMETDENEKIENHKLGLFLKIIGI